MDLQMNSDEIQGCIEVALKKLLHVQRDLFIYMINEESINHHLANYLAEQFNDYCVDVEYNKSMMDEKDIPFKLKLYLNKRLNPNNRTYRPDIVIHKRVDGRYNLLTVECKKENRYNAQDIEDDRVRVQVLASYNSEIEYDYGALVIYTVGEKPFVKYELYCKDRDDRKQGLTGTVYDEPME